MASLQNHQIFSYEEATLFTNLHLRIFRYVKLCSREASTLPYGKAWHPEAKFARFAVSFYPRLPTFGNNLLKAINGLNLY